MNYLKIADDTNIFKNNLTRIFPERVISIGQVPEILIVSSGAVLVKI